MLHVLSSKEERRTFSPIVTGDVHVGHLGIRHECADEFGWVFNELIHIKRLTISTLVVLIHVKTREHGFIELLIQKSLGMNLTQSQS